jgi:hypothetical protein
MSDLIKHERIGGKKKRCYQLPNGYFSDPFDLQDFWSVTLMPEGTKYLEADDDPGMVIELKLNKNSDVKFKLSNLSEDSQLKLIDNDLANKVENDQGEDEQ